MTKKMTGLLTAIALLFIAVAGIGKAYAYFTTYAQASGGYTIELQDETTIRENYASFQKTVSIENNSTSSYPVYVRAMAFSGAEYQLAYSGTGWTRNNDGYWYYGQAVEPGASTGNLVVRITDAQGNDPKAEEGQSFNIVIVYETIPAVESSNEPTIWTQNTYTVHTGGQNG